MAKSSPNNMCIWALNNGKPVCKGKDLLTECEVWSKTLCLQDITKVCVDRKSIKTATCKKNKKDLKTLVKI